MEPLSPRRNAAELSAFLASVASRLSADGRISRVNVGGHLNLTLGAGAGADGGPLR